MDMMLVLKDCDGIPDRVETLRRVFPGEVLHVCPHHLPQPGAVPVEVPAQWLPSLDLPRHRLEWFAADALGLAALSGHEIPEHVWFVESDVWAPDEVWRSVYDATSASAADGIFTKLLHRSHGFARTYRGFRWPGNPAWAETACILPLCRLSRRAIEWHLASIEELRECYSEVRCPSVIMREGGSVHDLREFLPYSAPRAFVGNLAYYRFTAGVMNHPAKNGIGKNPAC